MVAAVGPGSSPLDHAAVGLDFDERWRRLDKAIPAMRALWRGERYDGHFYSTRGTTMTPKPSQPGGPPIWLGSWGSIAGLRRVADLADGWLASAYHTTPSSFAAAKTRLAEDRTAAGGRVGEDFPNAVATFFFHITDRRTVADELVTEVLAPALNRGSEMLADRLAVGPSELFTERLTALHDAGAQRVYLWPLRDPLSQLELARRAWPG